jgi:ABC-type transport system involved in multi-copper enzyme maturation permease subunit
MCNLLINRLLGTCIDTIIVLFSVLAPNTSGWVFYYFSPVSWLSLSKVDFIGNESLPTPAYVISFLLISTMICFFISYVVFKRKDIQILEEI